MPDRVPQLKRPGRKPRSRARRESRVKQGYDSRWLRFRKHWILTHPVCERCGNGSATATGSDLHVDHIQPLKAGGSKYDPNNLQTLCRSCHSIKTAEDLASGVYENG